MSLTILHLSDLHISEKAYNDQKEVLDKLFLDLQAQRTTGQKIDLIIFSGDLIAKGDYSEANKALVKDKFIAPLLEASAVPSDCIFFTPGNHDLQHARIPPILIPSFEALNSVQRTNDFIENLENLPYLCGGFDSYNEVINSISTTTPVLSSPFFRAYVIPDKSIGICCINSAWKANGKPNDADYGSLQIGQRQMDLLISAVKECSIKFAILHHPLNWLAPFDQSIVQQQLYKEFDAIFYGHNHNANSLHIAGPYYSTFVSNAGCLYQSRDWFNGYSIIQLESDLIWKVKVREYYSQRNSFDVSTRFAENGEATFKMSVMRKTMQVIKFPSTEYINAVLESVNSHLLTTTISDVAPKNLGALFVPPPLCHISERQLNTDSSDGGKVKYLYLPELQAEHKSIFFIGQKEIGKTTLLHYICSECNNFQGSELPSFGCYVNLDSVKPTVAGLLENIVNFAKGAYRRSEFIDLLQEGRMTVCFDNLQVHDDKMLTALAAFIKTYPANRFYFSVNESFQASISQRVIPKLGLDAALVYMHSFGRRQTRNLISNWFGDSNEALRDRVDGMLFSLRRLNIPRTPFLISILLWVQEKNITFSPVNQAEIIDILIDGILDKLTETKELGGYDSTAKRHFLTELAYAMHKSGKKRYSHNELDKFAVDYFDSKGLPSASGPFIEELKDRGILIDLGDEVSFKFECMRAFFLSTNIKESSDLFKYSMTPSGLLELGEELDYFTGKNRDNKEALVGALDAVEFFYKQTDLNLDLAIFDNISLEISPLETKKRDMLENEIFGNRPTLEKQEELLDEIDNPHSPVVQLKAQRDDKDMASNFFEALQTASAILRNSELINDAELKLSAYKKLARYWCQLLLVVLALVEHYVDAQSEKPPEDIVSNIPPELGVYMMKMLMPTAVFSMARESLGTSKLELMIKNDIDTSPETVCKLFSAFLYADLELGNRLKILKDLTIQKGASRFLLELVFHKLMHIYMFRKLSHKEEELIKPILADIYTQFSDPKNQVVAGRIKSSFLSKLDRDKLFKSITKNES